MEAFVMKDVSASVLMDSTDLTVRKVKNRVPASLVCFLMKWMSHRSPHVFLIHPLKLLFWSHYKDWLNLLKHRRGIGKYFF